MAYDLVDVSEHSGLPQEGYLFEYFSDQWFITSSKQDVVINTDTYSPAFIKRTALRNENDMFKTTMTVTIDATHEIALLFRTWIEAPVLLTLFSQHYGDGDPVVLWSGKVSSCNFKGNVAELSCMPLYNTLKQLGVARVYQRACPHTQYDLNSCRLSKAAWETNTTITTIAGNTVTIPGAFSPGYFVGGSLVSGRDRRWITASTTNTVTLLSSLVSAIEGDPATLLPGCQHSTAKCRDVFGNILNNGGFAYIPGKNPFRVSLLG